MERKKHIQNLFLSNQPERGALKDQCAPRSFSENFALRAPTKDRALRSAERKTGAQVPSSGWFSCVTPAFSGLKTLLEQQENWPESF